MKGAKLSLTRRAGGAWRLTTDNASYLVTEFGSPGGFLLASSGYRAEKQPI